VTDLDSIAGAVGAAELYGTFSYEYLSMDTIVHNQNTEKEPIAI
jgi:hypothetical protein